MKSTMAHNTPERRICSALGPILQRTNINADFVEDPEVQALLIGMEFYLPEILREIYSYWNVESLDNFYLSEARKIDTDTADIRGVCILISDQTITPFHVTIKLSPTRAEIEGVNCRLGKSGKGDGNMDRVPWTQWRDHKHLHLKASLERIDWVYTVSVGDKRS